MSIGWQLTHSSVIGNEFIDGSTEIFKSGKWAFLTREVIQNSLDALREDETKLIVKMELNDIRTDRIPDRENIIKHLSGTLSISSLPERCKGFTENAKKMLENDVIRVLKISDYNTKGITGSEKKNGDPDSAWNALVYDEGNSQKNSENATGSFGTGKNAPFALSGLNTVFYATKDQYGINAFQGVAKLFTSYIDNKKLDRKIYYAKKTEDGSLRPLNKDESNELLDPFFNRNEIGSDVIIVGVDFDKQQTKKEIIQSVVENFFVLVAENKLEVDVFDEVIKKETLVNIINKYCETPIEYTNSNIKYGFVKQYLGVYTGEYERRVFEEDVVGAGKLKLMIAKGSDLNGKWVAMFRTKGMKIFDNNIRTAQQNYSALFFPGDDEVDRFLRKIENPTHDFFDPEIRIANAYEKEQAIQRYKKIKQWIKKKIEEYTEIIVNENDYLEGMEEYIQLDDNETEESAAAIPEVEIVNYETKLKKTMPQIQDKSKGGIEFTTKFTPDDGVSKTKHKFEGEGTDEPGTDKKGLVKDYHNSFKFKPRTVINDNKIKLAFALDEYDNITTNIEILSVGEDDSVTEEIPRIVEAIDLVTGEDLEIKNNAVVNIPVASTNLIEIQFERKFESRYKINVYQVRGDEDED